MLSTVTGSQLEQMAIARLLALRQALESAADLQAFLAGLAPADFTSIPVTDAQAIFTAVADANALWQYYETGQPPASYPQAASAYVYGASQRAVIGPQ